MPTKLRIGVMFGGASPECEQSLNGGRHVYHSLNRTRFEPVALYWDKQLRFWEIPETLVIRNTTKEIEERLQKFGKRVLLEDLPQLIDLAFLVTHGKYGDDGVLQGVLELLKIPYTGSGVLSAAVGRDKAMQRLILGQVPGIKQPPYLVFSRREWEVNHAAVRHHIEAAFAYPLVTKPTREGSTFGVMMIKNAGNLPPAVALALQYDNAILVEPYLRGREFSCVVMGNDQPQALPPTEVQHNNEIFTYDEKYLPGAAQKITPMPVPPEVLADIQRQCVAAYQALAMRGYARIDGFYTNQEEVLITDPNAAASCGMASSSWTFHQAAEAGISTVEFLSQVIDLARAAHQAKRGGLT